MKTRLTESELLEMLCPGEWVKGGDLNPKVTFLHACKHGQMWLMLSVMPLKHAGHNVVSCFDTWGNGGNVAKSLSFAHSGLLCCDPWSDSPGWLLIAPATLYQTDGSRGSLTWVQGKCNGMHAPQAFYLPSCLSLLFLLILLCNDLSALPLCHFLTLCLLFPSNSCIGQSVCVGMHHESYLAVNYRDLLCLQYALHSACVSFWINAPQQCPVFGPVTLGEKTCFNTNEKLLQCSFNLIMIHCAVKQAIVNWKQSMYNIHLWKQTRRAESPSIWR